MNKNGFFSIVSAITIIIAAEVLIGCQKDDFVENDNMEYIDIPEVETDALWFMDEVLNKKNMIAFYRFNSKVDLVNGFLKVKIKKGKDINISEQLFEKFSNSVRQTNQDVKDGKYKLSKEDGNILIVTGLNINNSRLKSGGNDDRVQLNKPSQEVGIDMIDAYKILVNGPSSGYGSLNDWINMASGGFNTNVYLKSGPFTFQGYNYTWMVSDYCTFYGQPQNCWANQIASFNFLNANSGISLRNGSGNISAITTTQPGAWEALYKYLFLIPFLHLN